MNTKFKMNKFNCCLNDVKIKISIKYENTFLRPIKIFKNIFEHLLIFKFYNKFHFSTKTKLLS